MDFDAMVRDNVLPKLSTDDMKTLIDQSTAQLGLQDTTQQAQEFAQRRRDQAAQIAAASKHLSDKSKSSTLQKIIAGLTGLGLVTQGLNKNKTIRNRSVAPATDIAGMIQAQRDKTDAENRQKYQDMIDALNTQGTADAQGYSAVANAIEQKNAGRRAVGSMATDIYGQKQANVRSLIGEQGANYRAGMTATTEANRLAEQKREADIQAEFLKNQQGSAPNKAMFDLVTKAQEKARNMPEVKALEDAYRQSRKKEDWDAWQARLNAETANEVALSSGQPFPEKTPPTPLEVMTQKIRDFKPADIPWYQNPNSGMMNLQDQATPLLDRQRGMSRPGRY
jgi:hypothetical protein